MTPIAYNVKETLVEIKDINLSYDGVPILRGVNASVKNITREGCAQGQVIGILGPSGVGKTQLSRVLAGLQEPTSGSVEVAGVGKVQPGLVGMVAQNYPLLRHRTVFGNLLVAQSKSGLPSNVKEKRASDYLNRFGLEDRALYYPSQLSGGQRQRVAIIQQLLCSEHYMIMDEPFTGLDPLMKDKTCDLINEVSRLHEENTIFIIAHDIGALVTVSDTLWLLGRDHVDGKVVPGSRIQAVYDLAAMGLAWQPNLSDTPEFAAVVSEIKSRFKML